MPVKFVEGDLFVSTEIKAYAHGCNCAGAMGRGIALEFKAHWPKMYEEYKTRCSRGEFTLGDVFVWEEEGQTIFNLGTQPDWKRSARLTAISSSVNKMLEEAEKRNIEEIALPQIGAGLGGLKWQDVKKTLEESGRLTNIQLLVVENYKPGIAILSEVKIWNKVVHCQKEPYDIYIGRGISNYGLPQSKWGNPFKLGRDGNRKEVLEKYNQWVRSHPELMESIVELRNKTLGCWCAPLSCHGDVLSRLVQEVYGKEEVVPIKPQLSFFDDF
jgi:O-acetyl-ADP-ribose deacetylase (regulator of RNase III)